MRPASVMPAAVRRVISLVAATTLCFFLGACAEQDRGDAGDRSGTATPQPLSTPDTTLASVATITTGSDAEHLLIQTQDPQQPDTCTRLAQASVTSGSSETLWIQVTYLSTYADAAHCPSSSQNLAAPLTIPRLKGRTLMVNNDAWALSPDGRSYEQCDDTFGCDPPPADHCDPVYVQAMLENAELAPERDVKTRACDGQWLVLDVDAVISGCAPVDGAAVPDGCDGGTHRRWFAKATTTSWDVVASGTKGGCSEVNAQVKEFPTRLCADLPGFFP